MFSCQITERFLFFSLVLVRILKFLFLGWSSLLPIEVGIAESSTGRSSSLILLSFMIPGHPFSKFFILFIKFFARRLVSVGFICKPLSPRFLALIFVLSIMSVSSWRRCLVSLLNAAFPSSVCKVGVEITNFAVRKVISYKIFKR